MKLEKQTHKHKETKTNTNTNTNKTLDFLKKKCILFIKKQKKGGFK